MRVLGKILFACLAALSGTLLIGTSAEANGCGVPYEVGTNTYSISLPLHFTLLASCTPTATFKLTADVDLTGITVARRTNFTGTFDGNGYTISNLTVTGSGLFDVGSSGASFTRVQLADAQVAGGSSGDGWAGALVRRSDGPVTITNSSYQGSVSGGTGANGWAGGFIGEARGNLTITDSYMKGSVVAGTEGNSFAGGFVGNANGIGVAGGTLSFLRNYMTGSIVGGPGSNAWSGGFFGTFSFFGGGSRIIENSFVRASATSGPGLGSYANGFIGDAIGGELTVRKSYFQGSLTSSPGNASAAVFSSGTATTSSMLCVTSCITSGSGVGTATASLDVLKSSVISDSWDFANTWCYSFGHNDGYPVLKGLTFGSNASWGNCATAPVPTSPAPEATTTTSTTTPTTSTTIGCQVASVQSGQATQLQPGQSLVVRDGSVVKSGVSGSATVSNRLVRVRERGIASGASVDVWLVKGRHFLGTLTADSVGAVHGRVELPQGIEAGVNTLQLVERNCNTVGNVMSLGLDLSEMATLPGTGNKTNPLTWSMGLLALVVGVVLRRRRIS